MTNATSMEVSIEENSIFGISEILGVLLGLVVAVLGVVLVIMKIFAMIKSLKVKVGDLVSSSN